jgi:Fe2+ transport system protein B
MDTVTIVIIVILILALLFFAITILGDSGRTGRASSPSSYVPSYGGGCGR